MALSLLIEQSPGRLHYKDLINEVSERLNSEQSLIEKHLNTDINFIRLVLGGMIDIHVAPANFTLTISDKPKTTTLTRYQASNSNRVTNQLHQSITISPLEQSLLSQMNGNTHFSEIVNGLLSHAENRYSKGEIESLCQLALLRLSKQALFI
jgi:methyltransferase-like protein